MKKNIKKIIAFTLVIMTFICCVNSTVFAMEYKTDKFEKFLCLHACYCKGELFTKPISDRVCEIHCVNHGKKFVVDLDEYLENGWCIHENNMSADGSRCLDCKQVFTYKNSKIDAKESLNYIGPSSNICSHPRTIEYMAAGNTFDDVGKCISEGYFITYCDVCQTEISNPEYKRTEAEHNFINGKCTGCHSDEYQEQNECYHKNTDESFTGNVSKTNNGTIRAGYYIRYCNDCGRELSEPTYDERITNHVFENGKCKECGYIFQEEKKQAWVYNTEGDNLLLRSEPIKNAINIIGRIKEYSEITVIGDTVTNGYYRIQYNNIIGYAHKDYITFSKPIVSNNLSSAYLQKVTSFLSDSRWKNGIAWNGNQTPKLSSYSSWGCCSYCADFVKYVFNKPSPRSGTYFTNINEIRNGDILYVTPMHWIVVLERNGNTLKTAEANWGSRVVVGNNYSISNGKLYRNGKITSTFQYGYHYLESTQVALVSSSTTSSTSQQTTQVAAASSNKKANFVQSQISLWQSLLESKKQAAESCISVCNEVNARLSIQQALGVSISAVTTLNPTKLFAAVDEDVALYTLAAIINNEYKTIADSNYYAFLGSKNKITNDLEATKVYTYFVEALASYDFILKGTYDTVSQLATGGQYTKRMLDKFVLGLVEGYVESDVVKLKKLADSVQNMSSLLETIKNKSVGLKQYYDTKNQWQAIWNKL